MYQFLLKVYVTYTNWCSLHLHSLHRGVLAFVFLIIFGCFFFFPFLIGGHSEPAKCRERR